MYIVAKLVSELGNKDVANKPAPLMSRNTFVFLVGFLASASRFRVAHPPSTSNKYSQVKQ